MSICPDPDRDGIFDVLQQKVTERDNYGQVTSLGKDVARVILKSWLAEANRQVTPSQWDEVKYATTQCSLPLFVRLVFDDICRWRSYSAPEVTSLESTIHESINELFGRIETQHGHVLVSRALGYLTAAKNGLSEAELEHLLSLDDQVLNDVYQVKYSYGPPVTPTSACTAASFLFLLCSDDPSRHPPPFILPNVQTFTTPCSSSRPVKHDMVKPSLL